MKNASSETSRAYAFGRFRLSADGSMLVRDGAPVGLGPKVLQTLLVLVERAGQVVRRHDLLQAVWPDSFVEETGLSRNISLLRQALTDDTQTLIVTVARIGYRFAAPVVLVDTPATSIRSADAPLRALDDGQDFNGGRPAVAGLGRVERDASTGNGDRRVEEPLDAPPLTRLLILPFRLLRDDADTGFLAFSVPDAVVNALTGRGGSIRQSRPADTSPTGSLATMRGRFVKASTSAGSSRPSSSACKESRTARSSCCGKSVDRRGSPGA